MCMSRNNDKTSNIKTANKSKRFNNRKKLIPFLKSATKDEFKKVENF